MPGEKRDIDALSIQNVLFLSGEGENTGSCRFNGSSY